VTLLPLLGLRPRRALFLRKQRIGAMQRESNVPSMARLTGWYTGEFLSRPSEPRPAADEIPDREGWYRKLLEALPVALYATDSDGRITFCNEAACELAGRRPELGSDQWCVSLALYWPDGTPMRHSECPMAIALKEDRPVRDHEILVGRPDGTRIPVLAYPMPLHDVSGKLIGAVNMLEDLSDRKKAEQLLQRLNETLEQRVQERAGQVKETFSKLQETERRFRLLVEGVTDYAIFMLDPNGIVSNWNPGAWRINGYRADEIIGQHFSRFYTAEDRASGLPQRVLSIAAKEGRFEGEGWRVRKDGERFWASVVIDPIRDDAGTLIGFAKITRDVTERRKAQEALLESAQMARGIIDTALDAFVQIDDAGNVLEWNAQAEAVFGWTRAEVLGRSVAALILPSAQREQYQKMLDRLVRSGEQRRLGQRLQLQALRRDGTEITVELSVTVLRHGQRFVYNGFIRDLTEKLAAEAQLFHAQKMEAVGQLTGGVAHDFNNLLTAIIGNLESLAATLPAEGSAGRCVDAALRAAWRGAGLTEQLLAFARHQEIRPEIVTIDRLLRDAELLCQKAVGEGVEIEIHAQENLWTCRIDPGQFEAAVLNLAANARDAMNGSGKLVITAENMAVGGRAIADLRADEYVVVSVTDTGCGMSREVLARAFEPFYTTKEAGKGTGLGLSQVYGFAQQAGGTARIESRKGAGTTVRLYLPRSEGEIRNERSLNELTRAVNGSATILVVEDDADVRKMVTELLSHLGYNTLVATNGAEALGLLRRENGIDLLFTDIVMPADISGVELARRARNLRPGLKVLLSSGHAGDEIKSHLLRGRFSFISKPYGRAALAAKLEEVLAEI
jgi:PAS domain S-box-containing protein